MMNIQQCSRVYTFRHMLLNCSSEIILFQCVEGEKYNPKSDTCDKVAAVDIEPVRAAGTDTDKVAAISIEPVRATGTDTDKVAAISIEPVRAAGTDTDKVAAIITEPVRAAGTLSQKQYCEKKCLFVQ